MNGPGSREPSPWDRLLEPHPDVVGLAPQRRARLAAGLLVALVPVSTLASLYYLWRAATTPGLGLALALGLLVLFALAYRLVRSPHPAAGVWLAVLAPWAALNVAWFSTVQAPPLQMVPFTVLPVVLAGLLVDRRAAAGFAVANLVVVTALLFYAYRAELWGAPGVMSLLFLLTLSALAIVGSRLLQDCIRDQEVATERLERSQGERMQLLNVIAHDLASPLSPIHLRLDLLRHDGDQEKHLPIIQRNVDHMERLIGDVRDLAKIQSGHLSVEKRPVAIDDLLRRATEGFDAPAKEHGITMRVDIRDTPAVEADPDRLNQVLYNLLGNAIRFSPEGSTIQVRASHDDGHARVEVQDQGRGLTKAEIERLFQPFSQVHRREEVKEKGTGLGLFISKGIIEAHGGQIWAESQGHGKGATFAFVLPVRG